MGIIFGMAKGFRFCQRPRSTEFYCHQHKLQLRYLMVAIVLSAIGGITWSYVAGLIPSPWKTEKETAATVIALSPASIDLGSGANKAIVPFYVRNSSDMDVYQVVIKLRLESASLSVTNDDIRIDVVDAPKTMEMPVPVPGDPFFQAMVSRTVMIIPGMDSKGRAGLWLIIEHLPPQGSAGFRIQNHSFKPLADGTHHLVASIASYTNSPTRSTLAPDGKLRLLSTTALGQWDIHTICRGTVHIVASARTAQIDGADIVTNAESLLMAGKWDEAEKEYTRAIQRNPSLGVAYGNRGAVLLRKGRLQDAYQDSLKALSLLPDDPLAYALVARCLRFLGRLDESLTNYTKATSLAGTNMPDLVYERGVVLSELNRMVEARDAFDQTVLLGYTNEWVRYSKGVTFLKENSNSNAITEFTAALAMRPDMADAYFGRGLAFGALNQFSDADRDLREAIRHDPSYAETLNEMKKANQVPEDTARKLADPQH